MERDSGATPTFSPRFRCLGFSSFIVPHHHHHHSNLPRFFSSFFSCSRFCLRPRSRSLLSSLVFELSARKMVFSPPMILLLFYLLIFVLLPSPKLSSNNLCSS